MSNLPFCRSFRETAERKSRSANTELAYPLVPPPKLGTRRTISELAARTRNSRRPTSNLHPSHSQQSKLDNRSTPDFQPSVWFICLNSAGDAVKCCDFTVAMSRITKATNRSVLSRSEKSEGGLGPLVAGLMGSLTVSDSF